MTNKARDFLEKYGKPGVHFPEEYATLKNWNLSHQEKQNLITKGLNSVNLEDRINAISHPEATEEHITKGLNDPIWEVRGNAAEHQNATSQHIMKALNDHGHIQSFYVRWAALQNPNVTTDHIDVALRDRNESIQQSAIEHPIATREQIESMLNHPNKNLSDLARDTLESRFD